MAKKRGCWYALSDLSFAEVQAFDTAAKKLRRPERQAAASPPSALQDIEKKYLDMAATRRDDGTQQTIASKLESYYVKSCPTTSNPAHSLP